MSWPLEYRVIWQREGQAGKNRRIYQTLAGAQQLRPNPGDGA